VSLPNRNLAEQASAIIRRDTGRNEHVVLSRMTQDDRVSHTKNWAGPMIGGGVGLYLDSYPVRGTWLMGKSHLVS
jgi:hypothetical protein